MESTLAVFFMCLSGATLLLVLVALFRSLSALLSRSPGVMAQHVSGAQRDSLLGEKRSLLQTLRDLQFERDTGKLSETDFAQLNTRYRARAREVLRELDQELSEYRQQASDLIAAELVRAQADGPSAPSDSTDSTNSTDSAEASAASDTAAHQALEAPRACAACDTNNDTDAVFCKKCGKPLGEPEATS